MLGLRCAAVHWKMSTQAAFMSVPPLPALLYPQVSGSKLHIRHYELGALALPSLEERYRRSPQFGFCASPHRPGSGAQLLPLIAANDEIYAEAHAASPVKLACFWPFVRQTRRHTVHVGHITACAPVTRSAARRGPGDAARCHTSRRATAGR